MSLLFAPAVGQAVRCYAGREAGGSNRGRRRASDYGGCWDHVGMLDRG